MLPEFNVFVHISICMLARIPVFVNSVSYMLGGSAVFVYPVHLVLVVSTVTCL